MWILLKYDRTPPGQWIFEQTEGVQHKWGRTIDYKWRANEISEFRTANHLPRPSYEESLVDLIQYTCQRLGGMGCKNTEKTYAQIVPAIRKMTGGGCGGCGAKLK